MTLIFPSTVILEQVHKVMMHHSPAMHAEETTITIYIYIYRLWYLRIVLTYY